MIENESYIGKYLLGQVIGVGQCSIVRKCYNPSDNCSYAIKMISYEENTKNQRILKEKQINNEINALNLLQNHSNLLMLKDFFHGNNGIYIITQRSQSDLVYLPPLLVDFH